MNTIVQLINNTNWCGRAYPRTTNEGKFIFWIPDNSVQFQTTYCTRCGNYVLAGNQVIQKISCKCRRSELNILV